MGLRKRAMTGEGKLWKRAGAERSSRRGEFDVFTQILNKISRTSVTACRGGSFRLRRRGERGGVAAREHAVTFERKLSRASCV
jgi:hypothetical protein